MSYLPGSISSLLAPSPPPCYLLGLCCLLLCVFAIIYNVVGISNHLPSPKNMQDKVDSSPHLSNADNNNADYKNTDNNSAGDDADDNAATEMKDNDADDSTAAQTTDNNTANNAGLEV
jgi:hypothetical protein